MRERERESEREREREKERGGGVKEIGECGCLEGLKRKGIGD